MRTLRLRIFPGTGEYTIYENDGHTFEYQPKCFMTIKIRVFTENEETVVEIEAREGEWTLAPREVIVELVGVGEQRFQDDGKPRSLKFQQ